MIHTYIHTYIHKSYLYSAYKFKRVTMRLCADVVEQVPVTRPGVFPRNLELVR